MRDGERLKKNLGEVGYDATNRLSCITLDVENLHSVVDHKSGVSTALQYARDFGSTAKESFKRTTAWSAYYYTGRGSWVVGRGSWVVVPSPREIAGTV